MREITMGGVRESELRAALDAQGLTDVDLTPDGEGNITVGIPDEVDGVRVDEVLRSVTERVAYRRYAATVDLTDTDPQPIIGLPSLYKVTDFVAHSPSVDLSTVNPGDGIALTLHPPSGLLNVAEAAGLEEFDGVNVKGQSFEIANKAPLSGDLSIHVDAPANGAATIEAVVVVLDLS